VLTANLFGLGLFRIDGTGSRSLDILCMASTHPLMKFSALPASRRLLVFIADIIVADLFAVDVMLWL